MPESFLLVKPRDPETALKARNYIHEGSARPLPNKRHWCFLWATHTAFGVIVEPVPELPLKAKSFGVNTGERSHFHPRLVLVYQTQFSNACHL
jgi:hypothetical protein